MKIIIHTTAEDGGQSVYEGTVEDGKFSTDPVDNAIKAIQHWQEQGLVYVQRSPAWRSTDLVIPWERVLFFKVPNNEG